MPPKFHVYPSLAAFIIYIVMPIDSILLRDSREEESLSFVFLFLDTLFLAEVSQRVS